MTASLIATMTFEARFDSLMPTKTSEVMRRTIASAGRSQTTRRPPMFGAVQPGLVRCHRATHSGHLADLFERVARSEQALTLSYPRTAERKSIVRYSGICRP